MNNDRDTNIEDLKKILLQFRDERNWKQFHTPKNIAEAISIEAGELLELFLWKKEDEIEKAFKDDKFKEKVRHELADILSFCINFSNSTGIDLTAALLEKIETNRKKYPIEKSKNTAKKYTEF